MIPYAPFEPDNSVFDPAASTVTKNVLPVQGGWGPMATFEVLATALSAEPRGYFEAQGSDGTWHKFVGTETKLHKYNTSTMAWDDVSQVATTYTLPNGDDWDFVQWGDTVIATNISDDKQVFDVSSSTEFADLAGSPPKSKYIDVLDTYLIALHLDTDPYGMAWSDSNNSEEWSAGDADNNTFSDGGGHIQGSKSGLKNLVIIQKDKMRLMQYWSGTDYVFGFSVLNEESGAVAPKSIIATNNTFFYLDEDGFYEGAQAGPIGAEKVNRWFLENVDGNEITQVQGAVDEANKMVFWRFAGNGGNKMLGYDWQLQKWAYIDQATSYIASSTTDSVTMEGLDSISASLDDLTISLDSRTWLGGRPAFAGFNNNYEFGYFSGANMAVELETSDNALSGPMVRSTLTGCRLITDAATHSIQIGTKANHGDSLTWTTEESPYGDTGYISKVVDGRTHRIRALIPAGEEWSHLHGVVPDFVGSGQA